MPTCPYLISNLQQWVLLKPGYDCDLYGSQGVHFFERHRAQQRGGGVAICIAEQLIFSVRQDLSLFDPEIESLFMEIEGSMLCNNNNNNKNWVLSIAPKHWYLRIKRKDQLYHGCDKKRK